MNENQLMLSFIFFGAIIAVGIPLAFFQARKRMAAWNDAMKKLGYSVRLVNGLTLGSRYIRGGINPTILTPRSRSFQNAILSVYDCSVSRVVPQPSEGKREIQTIFTVCEIVASHQYSNIFLKSKRNGFPDELWKPDFRDMEEIGLEGDFGKYFSVLTEKYKNSDALVFLTPDIMEEFIKHGADFDIEVAENKFFIYLSPIDRAIDKLIAINALAEYLVKLAK
jgi:hypothetical protein